MTTDADNAARAIREHLEGEPGDRVARMQLADLLEDEGDGRAAAVQRRLARLDLTGPECDEDEVLAAYAEHRGIDPDEVEVRYGWDDELCVHWFQAYDGRDGDERHVCCEGLSVVASASEILAIYFRGGV